MIFVFNTNGIKKVCNALKIKVGSVSRGKMSDSRGIEPESGKTDREECNPRRERLLCLRTALSAKLQDGGKIVRELFFGVVPGGCSHHVKIFSITFFAGVISLLLKSLNELR